MVKSIGNVQKDAQVRAIASGALSNGDTVVVNADGTVSVVAGSDSVAGTPDVFESASVVLNSATFDSSNNKVVISYRDGANNNYGTAVVGTVSGTSISFGTPVVFAISDPVSYIASTFDSSSNKVVIAYARGAGIGYATVGTVSGTSISFGSETIFRPTSNSTDISIAYDVNSGKVVIVYTDQGNNQYGTAVVGTVSGTAISFGSPVIYNSGYSIYNSIVYDSNAQKVVIAYRDVGNSNVGTAIVGTVSGASISFGSEVTFESGQSNYIAATFDSTNNKVVIAYQDAGNSYYATAVVGTVSGTSISFGTPVVFENATVSFISPVFDSNANKVVIAYRDTGNSNYGTFTVGTVSGTSISFETAVVFQTANSYYNSATFDSSNNKVVNAYRNDGNSGYGTAVVFQPDSTNLTSENFIGLADGAYADTQSAVINTTCSVDRNQTSLTAGQIYYVQTDGSLGLIAADPSVEAGTAISATEILVKG